MTPGPWTAGRLMGGFSVSDAKRTILAELRGSRVPYEEHKANAIAVAALPELIDVLKAAESYFGDLPSSDKEALRLHGKIVRALIAAGAELAEDAA
jgi:hypothetical protein